MLNKVNKVSKVTKVTNITKVTKVSKMLQWSDHLNQLPPFSNSASPPSP